jgi:hypothetical protein
VAAVQRQSHPININNMKKIINNIRGWDKEVAVKIIKRYIRPFTYDPAYIPVRVCDMEPKKYRGIAKINAQVQKNIVLKSQHRIFNKSSNRI